MKHTQIGAVGLALLAASCGGGADAKGEVKGTKKEAAKEAAADPAAADAVGDIPFDPEIISAEEAKAEAEEITPENADAEFEKLKQEIEGGG